MVDGQYWYDEMRASLEHVTLNRIHTLRQLRFSPTFHIEQL